MHIAGWAMTDDNLNAKKSKIMLVNNSKKYQFTTDLVMKDQVLEVVDEAKNSLALTSQVILNGIRTLII